MVKEKLTIKAYWYPANYNVGDTLTPHILKHFFERIDPDKEFIVERAAENESSKFVAVGSIMTKARRMDVIWGTGCSKRKAVNGEGMTFLAVRGKLTRALIKNADVPEVYGDPALLLPLIYNPKIEKKYKVGIIPHYVDRKLVSGEKIISVGLEWKKFVDEILSCEKIISSSLHGIVIAEAYGIPATWQVYSDKVIGKGFKFRDYLTGTGRKIVEPGTEFPPIKDLAAIQNGLINSLKNYYERTWKK